MKESISYTYLLNMMLVFIVISFCVIISVISYTKAFRLNSKIANAIEEAEGYNELSIGEINRLATSFGYQRYNVNCKNKEINGVTVRAKTGTNGYCIYEVEDDEYYYYGITTYMVFDFPVIGGFLKIPVYNTTERIYNFE